MMTDPISDLLTRIRNAGQAKHSYTTCPASSLKKALALVLKQEGFISGVEDGVGDDGHPLLKITLRYNDDGKMITDGIQRISRPGRRVYVGADEIGRVRNGLGMSILSTSKGVLCDRDARAKNVGGEVLCEVW
jgi:small subunit ribosomal protein S8